MGVATYPEIASTMPGVAFVVESQDLGFSVAFFCYVCVIALFLLHIRRRWVRCELGGPFIAKVSTSAVLALLWVSWVALVSWRALRGDRSSQGETIAVLVAFF